MWGEKNGVGGGGGCYFMITSADWKARGRSSLLPDAQTGRSTVMKTDEWCTEGRWDQVLTARRTDLWSGIQMFSHIYWSHGLWMHTPPPPHTHTHTSPPPDETCSHLQIFFFFTLYVLHNKSLASNVQVTWDNCSASDCLSGDVSAAVLQVCKCVFHIS